MATHKLSILVEALGAAKASKQLQGVDKSISNIGSRAGKGFRVAAATAAGVAAVGAAGIAMAVKSGLQDLATLESAVTSVDGAIRAMGLTGKITGAEIAATANDIEMSIGAAFDDKDITKATATLIRFGSVTPPNLERAMMVMTNLAAKTGSVDSAASMLAKALADPAKAAGKLARTGVVLTKQQQKQIATLVKAGKVEKAQAMLLELLDQRTRGAAAATQGPYQRALSTLADVSEDARKALAVGFLPVIERVADKLSTALADPSTMADIKSFGQALADGFDSVIDFAERVPWGTIKDGLKTSAEWAGKLMDVFKSMPPEAQATLVALAGLNKVSGGAISGIVGELGKGLIKGVLGMTAGVVHLKAGTVVGGGGLPGAGNAPAGAGAGGGVTGALGAAGAAAAGAGALVALREVQTTVNGAIADAFSGGSQVAAKNIKTALDIGSASINPIGANIVGLADSIGKLPGELAGIFGGKNGLGAGTANGVNRNRPPGPAPVNKQTDKRLSDIKGAQDLTKTSVDTAKQGIVESQGQIRGRVDAGAQTVSGATRLGAAIVTGATIVGASRVVGAIAANRPVVTTSVVVNVSGSSVTSSQTTQSRTGGGGGSRTNDSYGNGRIGGP